MSISTLTWEEFLKDSLEFQAIASRLGDEWTIHRKTDDPSHFFLTCKEKINVAETGETVAVEYHLVYSLSYGVPMLLMELHGDDGHLINLEDSWDIFFSSMISENKLERSDLLNMLTQMDHPVLFRPFLALHPCCTAQLLGQAGLSRNRIITFLSLMGPFVKLHLSNQYGLEVNSNETMSKESE